MKKEKQPSPQNNEAPAESSSSTSLDDVRKRLQSFGYLDNRIGSFYLASISRTASLFLSRCLLSLRVGLLVGTLAAILMLAGTLIFNPELLRRAVDLLLLCVYFELFFVLSSSGLELILIYAVSLVLQFTGGKRIFFAGRLLSFVIGVLFFSYFFYWGRTQLSYLRAFSNLSIAMMLFILILSCIFVARSSWLGFLVAFQQSEIGRFLPNWKRFGLEVALVLSVVLILLPPLLGRTERGLEEPPPVAVLSTHDSWVVIGVDGVSREMLDRAASTDSVPYLRTLIHSSLMVELQSVDRIVPPVVWSTIATGVSPAEHGILMPEVRRWRGVGAWMQVTPLELATRSVLGHSVFSQRQPVSGYVRKSKTFWEILSDYGLRAGVVNWWGSWPAVPLRGWNISERYYYKLMTKEKFQEETFPPELFQKFSTANPPKVSGPEMDRFYANIFIQQIASDPVRVAALYLPGFDILNYEFFESKKIDPFTYTGNYQRHMEWLDHYLRDVAAASPGAHLMILFHQGRSLSKQHSGVLIDRKWPAVNQTRSGIVNERSIAPLILYTCGLPVTPAMDSRLISMVVPHENLAQTPIRFIPRYAKKVSGPDSMRVGEFNDLLIEQMKSLGYLQ